ncbi:MAG TPA: phosphoenolpyruvate synthase [Flavobacteriaceae bacterium]|nr:phosphoenolpyruvate synthase [Flavobacteriaceae bacterium]HAT66270.1 phosphoenolpyruvate synthase [Flavobacteriaceae bacterium]|tara:strand:- start:104897 stop:107803 length:2907 start_codon:yes stop_codon:yes gene_type:complete
MNVNRILFFIALSILILGPAQAQTLSNDALKAQIKGFKADERGPYRDIRWFCEDGSIRQPKDPCPANIGPGVQHARYKEVVEKIGKENHIFLAQILAYTKKESLWDEARNNSRLKQYQLGKYLYGIDNGWILEKAQFYRGSIQYEDEQEAGRDFYKWILANDKNIEQKFFLIRESLKDVPHSGDDNLAQLMRSQSKTISDIEPRFMNLRVKIHSQPEVSDVEKVKSFKQQNQSRLSASVSKQLDELVETMVQFYQPIDLSSLLYKDTLLKGTPLGNAIQDFISKTNVQNASEVVKNSSELLLQIRKGILSEKRVITRLKLMDISLKLETVIFKESPKWEPKTLNELLQKIYFLGMANVGAGNIELWEWSQIEKILKPKNNGTTTLAELNNILIAARGEVEWSASMVKAYYQEVVNMYTAFEPKAYGFIDDRIRGSITLHLGQSVGELGNYLAEASNFSNKVLDLQNTSSLRGLNPGYAFGELVVVSEDPESVEVSSDKIYIFQRPPADLKPVAGIATVEEGNMVSHVQLLARNLGIPNAALSSDNLKSLKKYEGKNVFYAVSNQGTVILKLEAEMSATEKALFEKKERKEDKIEVPVDKIRLDQNAILNLRDVDATSSGNICGPKAANLGQLKKMFPDNVVEGLVIPFGIFKSHMDQNMPNQNTTYWGFLTAMFEQAESMRKAGTSEAEVEGFQLKKLETLRAAIKDMPLKSDFKKSLEDHFKSVLKAPMGNIPVFLRSDTNMEDLKDFTGAGLNLTLFNVVESQKIWDGIKAVWASPYTERSFKWRQKYLLNPENVFPSILIIPSVDVDYSGVMITKGIQSGNGADITVAFSRGAGGAVDGQIAETYLIRMDETYDLLAPAREPYFNSLPKTGGTQKNMATFESRILTEKNITQICKLTEQVRELMDQLHPDYTGAYDVELGFKDGQLWLFQIRPFVENKKALSSDYLESISPKIDTKKEISLNATL